MRQDRKRQWAIQHGLLIATEALFERVLTSWGRVQSTRRSEIDVARVALALGRLGDIDAFVGDLEGWLTRSGH